jgi:hypothetical protein
MAHVIVLRYKCERSLYDLLRLRAVRLAAKFGWYHGRDNPFRPC